MMSHQQSKAINRALSDMVQQVSISSASIYERKHGYLREYIEQGKKHFTHQWYDDFFEQDCEVDYSITEVIYDLHHEACLPLQRFFNAPNPDLFGEILGKIHYLVLAYVRFALSGEKLPDALDLRNSCFAFLASFFFNQDEQKNAFLAFQNLLSNPDECEQPLKMPAAKSLFPLSLKLAKENLSLEINQTLHDSFVFNKLYATAYAGFDGENPEQVAKIFTDLCDYHIKQSRPSQQSYPEFESPLEQCIPWEILVLLRLRVQKGLNNDLVSHPLINPFIPFVGLNADDFLNAEQKQLKCVVFQECYKSQNKLD